MAQSATIRSLGKRHVIRELYPWSFQLTLANREYLARVAMAQFCTWSRAINAEFDFVRTWGLPPVLVARLDAEAAQRGVATREVVQRVVYEIALSCPPVRAAAEPKFRYAPVSTVQLTPPNNQYALGLRKLGVPPREVVDRVLTFTASYGLPRDLYAAFEAEALRQKSTMRDFVLMALWRRAVELAVVPGQVGATRAGGQP